VRILVTGATGFIGSHLVRELLTRGHRLRATRRGTSPALRLGEAAAQVEWVDCDLPLASSQALAELAEGMDACVHCAWYVEPGRYAHAPRNIDWVGTSLRLLGALGEGGCARAVFVGTCFEYDHRRGLLTETGPTRPWTLYGSAKLATWEMGRHLAEQAGVSLAWARLFYQYGPHEGEGRLVPAVIRSLMEGGYPEVTQGTQIRDFLHVADVATALAAVLESGREGPVNIGSGRPVSVREVVETIGSVLGGEDRIRFGARPDNPSDPPFICADSGVLREEIGWQPRFDLDSGIRDAVDWWEARLGTPALSRASHAPGGG